MGDELVDDGVPLGGVTSTSEDVMDEGGVILQVNKKEIRKKNYRIRYACAVPIRHLLLYRIRYRIRYACAMHTLPLTLYPYATSYCTAYATHASVQCRPVCI